MSSAGPKRSKTRSTPASDAVDPNFARVIAAFEGDEQVASGTMMASVGLKVNGKIFAMLSRGKFVAKLPKERVDELVRSKAAKYFDPRRDGRLMKEWVELNGTRPPWIALAKEAYTFVKGKK